MDNCSDCGANLALVGRVHNCRPSLGKRLIAAAKEGRAMVVPINKSPDDIGPVGKREHVSTATYQYRDPVKRRSQVAEAMRRYRSRKRNAV